MQKDRIIVICHVPYDIWHMAYDIWSWRLINQHSFAAAAEFATDQGTDGRHTDDGGDHSDTSSPTIVARVILARNGGGERNSGDQSDAEADCPIKPLFIRIRAQRSPDLPYLIAFELRGLLIFERQGQLGIRDEDLIPFHLPAIFQFHLQLFSEHSLFDKVPCLIRRELGALR